MEQLSAPKSEFTQGLIGREGLSVGTNIGEGHERVDYRGHAPEQADTSCIQSVRVTAAVFTLVMLGEAVEDFGVQVRSIPEQVHPDLDMFPDQIKLLLGKRPRFGQQCAWQLCLTNVEKQAQRSQTREMFLRQTEIAAERH